MKTLPTYLVLLCAGLTGLACGSKSSGSTSTLLGTGGATSSASHGAGGAGGTMCLKCLAFTQGKFGAPCPGKSTQLLTALVNCKCQSSEASSCTCWCEKPPPSGPCLSCLGPSFDGTCNAEAAACQADQ